MKNKKYLRLIWAAALSLSLTAGGIMAAMAESATEAPAETETEAPAETETEAPAADREAEAEELLKALTGTYEQLWDVVLADEYAQNWLDEAAAFVGEENAEEAVEMLQSAVTGTLYGEEAVEAYADSEAAAFDCEFLQGVEQITFDGETISGTDAEGNELFSHTYSYVGYDEQLGFYEYATADADAGEFTYFVLRGDTPEETAHIEFRYGSDLEDLVLYDTGAYAYWMASGIPTGDNQELSERAIHIFCEENLQAE